MSSWFDQPRILRAIGEQRVLQFIDPVACCYSERPFAPVLSVVCSKCIESPAAKLIRINWGYVLEGVCVEH